MISVIVPVYKAEKYLHRCVDSILAQTYTDFELLLIDDGSPDNSGAICDEYAAKDSRVRVFHKKNGGVSSARNLGLDNARGEWISFVDSDDWLDVSCFGKLTQKMDADLIRCSIVSTDDTSWMADDCKYGIKEFVEKFEENPLTRTPCGALYKNSIIRENDIRFDPLVRFGEDMIFNFQYLLKSQSVRLLNLAGYTYYRNGEPHVLKYNLSLDEIKYSLSKAVKIKEDIQKSLGVRLKNNVDYEMYLSMYPIHKLLDRYNLIAYLDLCKFFNLTSNLNELYNNNLLSPIIRGISMVKISYEKKFYEESFALCEIIHEMSRSLEFTPRFKFKDFYLWYWLIKHKRYGILNYAMCMYFRLKQYINRSNC